MNTFPIIASPAAGEELFKYLKSNPENKLFWDSGRGSLMEYMTSAYIWGERMTFHNFFKKLRERFDRLKIKEESYGDLDQTIKILEKDDKRTVFHLADHCTCADINNWIIIHEFDKHTVNVHIREIHTRGDYPRSAYPKKLNLKFWKDRDYICDYVNKHHMTNLGSVYGDIRDTGYVVSYKMWLPVAEDAPAADSINRLAEMDSDGSYRHNFYNEWKHWMFYINCIGTQIEESEEEES